MDQEEILFTIQLSEGHSFRNLIDIINKETETSTMVLSIDEITIDVPNKLGYGAHKIVIDTREISDYSYNVINEEGELEEYYRIAFDPEALHNAMKGIGKQDGFILYQYRGDPNMNLHPIKSSSKGDDSSALIIPTYPAKNTNLTSIDQYTGEPLKRIDARNFSDLCSQMQRLKCASVEFTCEKRELFIIRGILPSKQVASIFEFRSTPPSKKRAPKVVPPLVVDDLSQEIEEIKEKVKSRLVIVQPEEVASVTIPIATIKALSKIHNVSPRGTQLRFYLDHGLPLTIESPIGTYGKYTITLRTPKSN